MDTCDGFTLDGVAFLNSPQYHVNLHNVRDALVQGVTVLVDIEDQLQIFRYLGGAPASASLPEGEGRPCMRPPVRACQ